MLANIPNPTTATNQRMRASMYLCRSLAMLALLTMVIGLPACGVMQSKAHETRTATVEHVTGMGVHVKTANGAIKVTVDAARTDVEVIANVTTTASTLEEAELRLSDVKIIIEQGTDGILTLWADYGPNGRRSGDGCSFEIALPEANGVTLKTSNGGLTLTGGSVGAARLTSSNGRIKVLDHVGALNAGTSNGGIVAEKIDGRVDLGTSNGGITFVAAAGCEEAFTLQTSNGNVRVTIPTTIGGTVNATTSNGSVSVKSESGIKGVSGSKKSKTITLDDTPGMESRIRTSNGTVTVTVEE